MCSADLTASHSLNLYYSFVPNVRILICLEGSFFALCRSHTKNILYLFCNMYTLPQLNNEQSVSRLRVPFYAHIARLLPRIDHAIRGELKLENLHLEHCSGKLVSW